MKNTIRGLLVIALFVTAAVSVSACSKNYSGDSIGSSDQDIPVRRGSH